MTVFLCADRGPFYRDVVDKKLGADQKLNCFNDPGRHPARTPPLFVDIDAELQPSTFISVLHDGVQ